jgi:hypothetical protein
MNAAELGKDLAALYRMPEKPLIASVEALDAIDKMLANLPAILDALACKAAVDAIRADSTAPFDSEDVAERAAKIRATWETR